jgi:DNA-binding transcriptional MerR regulator
MGPTKYSLQQLANLVGIEPRTIRSYIQQGLLHGPESRGRNASYDAAHLEKLQTIKQLRDHYGLSLKEIRETMWMGNQDLYLESTMSAELDEDMDGVAASPPSESALDYVRSLKERQVYGPQEGEPERASQLRRLRQQSTGQRQGGRGPRGRGSALSSRNAPLEHLLERLRESLDDKTLRRSSRVEAWLHVKVLPELMLAVRGHYTADQIALVEQIADCMRQILLGGYEDDEE